MDPHNPKTTTTDTVVVTVYVAGGLADAKRFLRKATYPPHCGLCVTVTPTTFIYTGGSEDGVAGGLVQYPRFPKSAEEIWWRAVEIARGLLVELCQTSALVVGPQKTMWLSCREDG